jgi:hypothetical protein
MVRRALIVQAHGYLRRQTFPQFGHDTRLANSGFRPEQDNLTFTDLGLLPSRQRQRDLLLPTHQTVQPPPA